MSSAPIARVALDFVDDIASTSDVEAIRELLLDHSRKLGFDRLIVCELPVAGQSFQAYVCNWESGFFDRFRREMVKHGPIMKHASQTTEPFVWLDVEWDRSRHSPEQRVMDEAADAGMEAGFVVPVVGVKGDQSCLGLSGRAMALQDDERRALHLMCLFAHHAARQPRTEESAAACTGAGLTDAERDCLSYAFMGYDADGISERTVLSAGEVRALSRQAARWLGIESPAEAAVQAALLGKIQP